MTREEFIEVLENKRYSYEIEGDKIVVTDYGYVDLSLLTSLPSVVEFNNRGDLNLKRLKTLPPGVQFKNWGDVYLNSLKTLPPDDQFNNKGYVNLSSLTSLPPGVQFHNGGGVYLESIIGGWFNRWSGNIEGIDSTILLNLMIKRGMFI